MNKEYWEGVFDKLDNMSDEELFNLACECGVVYYDGKVSIHVPM